VVSVRHKLSRKEELIKEIVDNIDDYLQNERDVIIDNQDVSQGSMNITPNEQGKIAMKKVVTTFDINDYEDEYNEVKDELELIENNTISSYTFSGPVNVHSGTFNLGSIPENIVGEDTISKWANSETDFSVNVNVPAPTVTTAIEQPGYYKFNNNWNALVSGTSSDYNLHVNISPVTPTLITKSIDNNGTYLASSDNADGFSSVIVAVRPYLPNNLHQTLNYVGYWKWDATNNLFVRGNGIDSSNYDILIEPIWYDGDNGQKKRIRISNGIVYDVNMVDTDFNGGQEVNVFQNTPQVQMLQRSLKNETKSRDVSSMFNSFEIEGIPPTISTAITSNGYYKFNENWNGLTSGTSSDYNLNINVNSSSEISKININSLSVTSSGRKYLLRDFNKAESTISVYINSSNSLVTFTSESSYFRFTLYVNNSTTSESHSISNNKYYLSIPYTREIYLFDENGDKILNLNLWNYYNKDNSSIMLYKNKYDLILN